MSTAVALSIAGSDSGGGAGVQADLRTFGSLGVFGTTVITALTAQNLVGVDAVLGVTAEFVEAQLQAVLQGFPVAAAKTGMLWSAEIIHKVAAVLAGRVPLVVDPVMVASSGGRLLQDEAVDSYRQVLLPRCLLATPNLDEAAVLLGVESIAAESMPAAVQELAAELGCSVLLKGGHLPGDPVDVLCHQGELVCWTHPRLTGTSTHGTGCMLSAAITALLAGGKLSLIEACEGALRFVHAALAEPVELSRKVRLAGIERAHPQGTAVRRL